MITAEMLVGLIWIIGIPSHYAVMDVCFEGTGARLAATLVWPATLIAMWLIMLSGALLDFVLSLPDSDEDG